MASLTLGSLDLLAEPFKAQVGTSMGAWTSITTTVDSMFVDGSVVTGDATGNREIVLQVRVQGASRPELIAACEALVSEANQPSNLLTWTPDDGPASVYEVFRAGGPQRSDDGSEGPLFRRVYELHLPARPFVRGAVHLFPAAAAPVVGVEDFEGSPIGVAMVSPATTFASSTYLSAPVVDDTATPIHAQISLMSASEWPTVSGATVTSQTPVYGGGTQRVARFSDAGTGFTASTPSWPCGTGDFVTVALAAWMAVGQTLTAGVEWLDSVGTSLGTDWGIGVQANSGRSLFNAWVVGRRPSGATQVRALLAGTFAGTFLDVVSLAVMPAGGIGSLTQTASAAFQGTYGLYELAGSPATDMPSRYTGAVFVHGEVPPWVDVSGLPTVGVWIKADGVASQILGADAIARLRFYDAGGNWAQWDLTGTLTTGWTRCTAPVGSPSGTSGTLDMSAVISYDLSLVGTVAVYKIDYVHAGPEPTALLSTRGTVLTLDVLGSAPSTADVVVSSSVAMSNWLVSCIDGTEGEPLLTVTSNVATAPAPAGYDSVYQVLGCLAPSASLTSPTCTVVQKINGTAVGSPRVLTGTTRAGNAYVDFGTVELPLIGVPAENAGVSYTFTLAPASTSWVEVLVIDQGAATVLVDNLSTPRKFGFVDEPDLLVGMGMVWVGDLADRTDARAPLSPPSPGRPVQVRGPSTRMLVYSTGGAPDVALSYFRHDLVEPT